MARDEVNPDRIYSFLSSDCEGREPAENVDGFLRTRSERFRRLYFYEERICTHCRSGFPPTRTFRNGFNISDLETSCGAGAPAHEMACP